MTQTTAVRPGIPVVVPVIPLTPSFLVAAANVLVGFPGEGGNNCGRIAELFLRGVRQLPGQPWCAAFVHHVGFWSHYDCRSRTSSWPLPPVASCGELETFAKEHGVLRDEPKAGDVFLLWNATLAGYAHTGIVTRVRAHGVAIGRGAWFDCDTIEGNTDSGEDCEGDAVMRRVRRFYPRPRLADQFIRWADLDRRCFARQVLARVA
jgi:hypothetical protein